MALPQTAAENKNPPTESTNVAANPDWKWAVWFSAFVVALTALPLVWGLLTTPSGGEYSWLFYNASDANTYLAYMNLGRRGEWLLRLMHTSENGDSGSVIYMFYILLGKVAGLLGLPNVVVYQLSRLLLGWLFLLLSYRFIARLFSEKLPRRYAFVLTCLAAGLGWLFAPLGLVAAPPPDWWIQEAFTFLIVLVAPHFPAAALLLLTAFSQALFGLEGKGWRHYLWGSGATLILGFIHPFLALPFGLAIGLTWLRLCLRQKKILWQPLFGIAAIGAAILPGVGITFLSYQQNPVIREWLNQQDTMDKLTLFNLLVMYGFLLPLAFGGIWWAERRLPQQDSSKILGWQLVTHWAMVALLLVFAPITVSHRMLEGSNLALACLASAGWYYVVAPRLAKRWRSLARRSLTIVMTFSTLAVIFAPIVYIYAPHNSFFDPTRSPHFSQGEVGAFAWFNQQAKPEQVVITGPLLGNVVPARTHERVFYGHWNTTLFYQKKLEILNQFFAADTTPAARQQIISQWGIDYLLYGWRERQLGGFDPAKAGWPLLYDSDSVQIYRLR